MQELVSYLKFQEIEWKIQIHILLKANVAVGRRRKDFFHVDSWHVIGPLPMPQRGKDDILFSRVTMVVLYHRYHIVSSQLWYVTMTRASIPRDYSSWENMSKLSHNSNSNRVSRDYKLDTSDSCGYISYIFRHVHLWRVIYVRCGRICNNIYPPMCTSGLIRSQYIQSARMSKPYRESTYNHVF